MIHLTIGKYLKYIVLELKEILKQIPTLIKQGIALTVLHSAFRVLELCMVEKLNIV